MLKKEDHLWIEVNYSLSDDIFYSLQLLYGALLEAETLQLYHLLYSYAKLEINSITHKSILNIYNYSIETFEKNRKKLEEFLLLKTYFCSQNRSYIYQLQKPKNPQSFLNHDVFGRMYLKKMGNQVYEQMKQKFALQVKNKKGYEEITVNISNLLSDWDDNEEEIFMKQRPSIEENNYNFDFSIFLNQLSPMLFPLQARTKETLDFIAEKASIYGVSEKEMRQYVGRSIDIKTNTFSKQKLINQLQKINNNIQKVIDDPYQLPPIQFLKYKQNGVPVTKVDQVLIDEVLSEKYHFNKEVINVLIEYALNRCNQMLKKKYVEQVASTWVRLKIDTKEKALAQINNENKKPNYEHTNKNQLPQWYYNPDIIEKKERTLDEDKLLNNLRKLGEINE